MSSVASSVGSGRPTALSVERAQRVGRDERQVTAETRRRAVPGNGAGEHGSVEKAYKYTPVEP
ncbi:uncharacterized protein LAESUDRAFT_724459 [Laetiporus sulphureus 93-53]|uniref:Uncharacterized protein n=1 Tax=Laetiporus sulphureus 93-53 TaxID=1314785 RepID=A0A165EY95_9APHY|nr:uncharacterized protein LAESUDRAFT_724459 [Laetiporus sulphureus 93-53]KZT07970.1 hypothetical protein LAESUDRAFT_724459 [Laetiporus sulphureus 93-53]